MRLKLLIIFFAILFSSSVYAEIIDPATETICSDGVCNSVLYSGTMFAQDKDGNWVNASDVLSITKDSDDLTFRYEGIKGNYSITFETGVFYNDNYFSMYDVKQLRPDIQFNFPTKKTPTSRKYAVNITNIPIEMQPKINNITLTYKSHSGFDLSQLKKEGVRYKVKDIFQLLFNDLIENDFTVSINKDEKRIYISNLTDKYVSNSLYLDPILSLTGIAEDGYVIDSDNDGNGNTATTGFNIIVGDNNGNWVNRGFSSFNITTLKGMASIDSVSFNLYLYDAKFNGTSGYYPNGLGASVVDHLDYGKTLDASDFQLTALNSSIATLIPSSLQSQIATFEYKNNSILSSYIQDDLDADRNTSQFRMRYETTTDNDGVLDAVYFYDSTGTDPPKMNITYRPHYDPNLTTPNLLPVPARTGDDLICNFTIEDLNSNQNLTANVSWYRNGVFNISYNDTQCYNGTVCNSTLSSSFTAEGDVWNCTAMASDGYNVSINKSAKITISNTAPPTPSLIYPDNLYVVSNEWTWLNFSSVDVDNENVTYYIYADTNNPPQTLNGTTNNISSYNFSGLSDGTYYWNVMAGDEVDNSSNSSIRSFIVSTTSPAINPVWLNNSWTTNTSFTINFTATDGDGVGACELWLNSTGWHLNQTLTSVTSGVKTNFSLLTLPDENKYLYNIWCNDSLGNGDFYSYGNITLGVDTINPNLTVTSPIQGTTYNTETVSLTITASDTFLDKCYYDLYYKDSGSLKESNNSINCAGTTTLNVPYYSGGYMVNISVNDSAGNLNSTHINFTTQTSSSPTITSTGGATGGDEKEPEIVFVGEGNFTASTKYNTDYYDIYITKGANLTYPIYVTNYNPDPIIVYASCTNSSICEWVTILDSIIEVSSNRYLIEKIDVNVLIPKTINYGEEYHFSVKVVDAQNRGKIISFKLTARRLGYFFRSLDKLKAPFYTIKFSEVKKDTEDVVIPNLVPVIFIPLILWLLVHLALKVKILRAVTLIFFVPLSIILFIPEMEQSKIRPIYWGRIKKLSWSYLPITAFILTLIFV